MVHGNDISVIVNYIRRDFPCFGRQLVLNNDKGVSEEEEST